MTGALAGAALWLALLAAALVFTAAPPRPAAASPPPGGAGTPAGPDGGPPALLNLCVTGCRLDAAAYAATILDLAAHGGLVLTEPQAGHLRCGLPPVPVAGPGLTGFERLVLAAGPGSA